MNGLRAKRPNSAAGSAPVSQLFNCTRADCGMTFTRKWKLQEHEAMHAGVRPCKCTVEGCARTFTRRSHLVRHMLQHGGVKKYICKVFDCKKSFIDAGKLKRHVRYYHGNKAKYFQCVLPNCSMTFKKRRQFKLHLQQHELPAKFKCSKIGCGAMFDSHIARKAHEKKHAGYRCLQADCKVVVHTWGKLQKHMRKHPATFPCSVCRKVFKKVESRRKHKRTHAFHKPVLVCPMECNAYFSSTFNLQSHIRKVHLKLLKYKCSFPDCSREFAMRESLNRHLLKHDTSATLQKKRKRCKKTWQKRLEQQTRPLVEEDLSRLFDLRMRMPRRVKVETNLSGLFNERKIPHFTDQEVNLRNLFSMKRRPMVQAPQVAPLKG